ncbi:MAG: helix-turn-helix domain-containing protein [Treponema sp.]|nr:helix-turn-helix domain-containing protein [Treponema sp.]
MDNLLKTGILTIPQELISQSQEEYLYQEYHDAKKDPLKFSRFLKSLDKNKIVQNTYFIPEIKESVPEVLPESTFFGSDKKTTIVIRKHPKATPIFTHSHEFLEFFYVLKGKSDQKINEIDFKMNEGDLCLIPPNIRHSLSVFDDSIILNILVRRSTFEKIFHNFLCMDNILSSFILNNMYSKKAADYLIFHTYNNPEIHNLIIEMYNESKNPDLYTQDLLQIYLHKLFILLLRNSKDNYDLPPDVNKDNLLRFDIIRYIQDSYKEISLENLAENFRLTPQYASKLIKQITGHTFSEIVLNIRMQQACSLLKNTKIPIGDIAYEIGYLNPEHFIRIFKRKYNITPKEFRLSSKE